MRAQTVKLASLCALTFGGVCLLSARLSALESGPASASAWESSPYRNFGAPETLLGGRAVLRDEAEDETLGAGLSEELKRLAVELHEKQGWRVPIADGEPLRIFIARNNAEGVHRVAVRGIDRGLLLSPAIQLDATNLSTRQIVHEVGRLYAFATLQAYGLRDRTSLTASVAEYLAGHDDEPEREAARLATAAPVVNLFRPSDPLGRWYVDEFVREAGGPAALRAVWERAAERREEPLDVLVERFAEATGLKEDALTLRFAARLYMTFDAEPAFSRISLADLQSGALDAATPPSFSLRHRAFLPDSESAYSALRVSWPEQGAGAAAVVRYRDPALPADVVFLHPGRAHVIPLLGVSRVDFLVAGSFSGPPLFNVAAAVEPVASFPFAGLSAQAMAGPGGTRVSWTTASHEGLLGWAIFREEVLADGRIERRGPEMVPSTSQGEESFRYMYVDVETSPATFYRYTVWAVTEDGLLARAFSATLRTAE
jgi:hypothetical protein